MRKLKLALILTVGVCSGLVQAGNVPGLALTLISANQVSYGLGWGLFESAFGHAFFKEGHDDGTNNYVLCLDETKHCILMRSNSSNGESIFLYLVDDLLGKTGLPWEWEGYVPYDHK